MIELEPGERVYLIKRQHPIILQMIVYPFVAISILLLLFILFILFFYLPPVLSFLTKLVPTLNMKFSILFFCTVLLLFFWHVIGSSILSYYLNCFVVTNKRVIQVEFKSFFNITYSSLFHDKIQDITISVRGILASMFRFGNIEIETAGGFRHFIFRNIPDPEIIKQVILEAKRDYFAGKT